MQTFFKHCLLAAMFFAPIAASAQVTIGSGMIPERGALLDFKQTAQSLDVDNISSLENATKGVLYPKVFLHEETKLTPLYGGTEGNGGVWSDEATAEEKLKATGMVVYNVNPNAKNLNEGLYLWQGSKWVKLTEGGGVVIQPVECFDIRINGAYIQGKSVTADEYIELDLNITKKGTYTISAISGNGYSFYYTGEALETGAFTVRIPAQGKPNTAQTDVLTFNGIVVAPGCEPVVLVQEPVAAYTVICSSNTVHGSYIKNQPLTTAHYIEMRINISQPGSYHIYTEEKNGISFEAKGSIQTAGTYTIRLDGKGRITLNEDFDLKLYANTTLGQIDCSTHIAITLPAMTYAILGYNVWSWNTNARIDALKSTANFGPDGTMKIAGLEALWVTDNIAVAANNLNNGYGGKQPDIFLYFSYDRTPTAAINSAIANYINSGGCVLYATPDADSNPNSGNTGAMNDLMQAVFGASYRTAIQQPNTSGEDAVYPIASYSGNPITDGPFGDLGRSFWGEDNGSGGTMVMTSLPPGSIQICTAQATSKPGVNPAFSVVWYNDAKNFVFFGDSGGASVSNNNSNEYPTRYTPAGLPVSKLYGPTTNNSVNQRYITNAALELNAVSYLLKKAVVAGINPY